MSLLKDFKEQHLAVRKRDLIKEALNPVNWYDTISHRHQRAERGYSNQDAWDAGTHVLQVTSGLLKELASAKAYLNWEDYFKTNYKTRGYENFEEVIKDIDDYLA